MRMHPPPPNSRAQRRAPGPTRASGWTLLLAWAAAAAVQAAPEPPDPQLPPLPSRQAAAPGPLGGGANGTPPAGWQASNPYRSDTASRAQVLAAGAAAYARHCAACHGEGADQTVPEGPDLRRLNSSCNRLRQTSLRPRCLQDVDTYFLESVLTGKRRAGQMHMPAWSGLIAEETVWAIRSYTESRPLPPPRLLPDLPAVGAAPASGR